MVAPRVHVLGHRGMLGSVVARRWVELGAQLVQSRAEYTVNAIRPDDPLLSERLAEFGGLVQPSTDAIAEPTAYAATKRLLERLPAVTLRAGLVDVTRQPAVAFTNWACNPITPLEWADLAWELRDTPGVHVIGREPVTRYEVARLVAELWGLPRPTAGQTARPLSRVQTSGIGLAPLGVALRQYRDWLRA